YLFITLSCVTEAKGGMERVTASCADISAIECLPGELLCAIINYVPEAVHYLRLTSKVLKHAANVYISQTNLVHKFEISGAVIREDLRISMHILPHHADLFELRLKQNLSPSERKRIRRDKPNGISSILVHRLPYFINEGPDQLISLRRCMGKVDMVSLNGCLDDHLIPSLHTLLGVGIIIDTLMVTAEKMPESVATNLLHILDAYQINDLRLSVGDVSTDPFKLLFSLSSRLHTLSITQLPLYGMSSNARFFLGQHYCDWTPTFLSMLALERRLDKLCIDNRANPRYLSSATTLAKELPSVGKNIWFETNWEGNEISSMKINGHYVNVGARFLSIKHASRVNEPLNDKGRLKIKEHGGYDFIS
ncbi:hypothetical protein PMAYCL1PPCAC_20513, partial [Pristionchus mayeri]